MYGITVNTGYEIQTGHPNRSGKFGLVYPAQGKTFSDLKEAESVFAEVVASQTRMGQEFVATLNHFHSRGQDETLRRVSGKRREGAIHPSAFSLK